MTTEDSDSCKSTKPITALVASYYDKLWNEWDDSAVDDTLAPGVKFRGSLGTETVGRDGWRSYRDEIRRGAPDFHNKVLDAITARNRVAARLQYTGTHSGPLLGIPATGRRFTYSGAAFFTAKTGLLTDIWVVGDLEGLRNQLFEGR